LPRKVVSYINRAGTSVEKPVPGPVIETIKSNIFNEI
jgi:hypothetical protein